MTASIVDELTDTGSYKNRECVVQGIANIVTDFLGGEPDQHCRQAYSKGERPRQLDITAEHEHQSRD